MNINCTFKHVESSDELIEYAEGRAAKLSKHKMKPIREAHFVFRAHGKGHFEVELLVSEPELAVRARASGENFYHAVDKVVDRVCKQMARKKSKVQYHKKPLLSAAGRIDHPNSTVKLLPKTHRRAV